ncbi:MAG TPA: DUF1592 domain-containing protein [Pirellulaceae bacterium]|nr:DUF1592 domain-containing protein [Pirellulaceae bacterium]
MRERVLTLDQEFRASVGPLVTTYCADCHSPDVRSGGIAFDAELPVDEQVAAVEAWLKGAGALKRGEMPPEDGLQPSDEERAAMIAWAEKLGATLDGAEPFDPGAVVFRRLTRKQYENTVQDLFGLKFEAASAVGLPEDPKAFGYDAISTALDVSPTLFEQYAAAADLVLDRLIAEKSLKVVVEGEASQFELLGQMPTEKSKDGPLPEATEAKEGARIFRVNAAVTIEVDVPEEGLYRVGIDGWGHKGPPWETWWPELSVETEGAAPKSVPIRATEKERAVAETLLSLPAGKAKIVLSFENAKHGAGWQENEHRFKYVAIDRIEVDGPASASGAAVDAEANAKLFFVRPGGSLAPREAARQVARRLAELAFRRPVADEEIDRLLTLFDLASERGLGYERSLRPTLKAILLSPSFLFRIEEDRGQAEGFDAYAVDDHELATRLSYFLWGTTPDEELRRLADEGKLHEPETLRAQATRLIEDPRSKWLANDFAMQWLRLHELETALPSEEHFPEFDARLRSAMRQEALLFFDGLVREDRSVVDLLDADYAYINRDLALFYRFGKLDEGWRKEPIDKNRNPERGGLLGMGAVLSMTSHVARNSPTRRGQWVMDVIHGDPPPPPPANVEQIDESGDLSNAKSFRELLALHANESTCAGCHRKMDPLGFALDQFDPVGRFQRERGGEKIDASGTLPDGRSVNGVVELKQILLEEKELFVRNLTEQLLIYALGRNLESYDRPTVARIVTRARENDWRMREILLGIVESYPFRYRRDPDDPFAFAGRQ